MIHWRAARLLAQLPDDNLPRDVALEVRAHVASCARCRRRLHEIQVSEALLRRLPPSIVPLDPLPDSYVRLAALARWSDEQAVASGPEGWRISLVGVAGAVLIICVAASAGTWAPTIRPGFGPSIDLEALPPDHAYFASNYR